MTTSIDEKVTGDFLSAPECQQPIEEYDRINREFHADAFDRWGRLSWKTSKNIDDDPGYGNAHIIEVLCEDTPDASLAFYQNIGVSYIFAGKTELDLPRALKKLRKLSGIQTLLLEGGSILNGAFLRDDVIDELSLVVAPLIARPEDLSLFENSPNHHFRLFAAGSLDVDAVWLRYQKPERKAKTI